MKLFKIFVLSFSLSLCFSINSYAQRNFTEEADKAYELKQFTYAIELYQKAYSKIKRNKAERARILFQIGECYRYTNNQKRSEAQYRRVTKSGYPDPIAYMYLAEALKQNEKYDEAIVALNDYKAKVPNDPKADKAIEACKLSQMWKDNPTRYVIENVRQLNSRENDFTPSYADKKFNSLIFTSSRDGVIGKGTDTWTGENFTDLFYTELSKAKGKKGTQPGTEAMGTWSAPVILDEGIINTPANEGSPALNDRGNTMYFTRCNVEKRQTITCKIFSTQKKGRGWAEAEVLTLGPDSFNYGHPTLSQDELTLYFASDMAGTLGGKDIWMAKRDRKTRPFDKPVNLGPTINTEGNEMYPFIKDNGVLYFSSDGHVGMGGLDMFKSEKVGETWGTPENMKFPMNSPNDDFAIIYEGAQEKGYFCSNRNGGRGGDDIYSFFLPPLVFTLQGVVKDAETKQIIEGAIVKLVGSDGTSIEDSTDKAGSYKFGKTQILPNTTYELYVSKPNYFSSTAKETTVGVEQSRDFIVNFDLVPIPKKPIELPEILYDLARWELLPQYQDSLNGLISTLKDNPKIVIELASHTDARDSDANNDTLSQKRAESVVNYLIEKGIAPDRMVAKGYGERVPRTLSKDITRDGFTFKSGTVLTEQFINALTTLKEREAAHQLNRRTEFRILRDDYIPKDSNIPLEKTKIQIIDMPENLPNDSVVNHPVDSVKTAPQGTTPPQGTGTTPPQGTKSPQGTGTTPPQGTKPPQAGTPVNKETPKPNN